MNGTPISAAVESLSALERHKIRRVLERDLAQNTVARSGGWDGDASAQILGAIEDATRRDALNLIPLHRPHERVVASDDTQENCSSSTVGGTPGTGKTQLLPPPEIYIGESSSSATQVSFGSSSPTNFTDDLLKPVNRVKAFSTGNIPVEFSSPGACLKVLRRRMRLSGDPEASEKRRVANSFLSVSADNRTSFCAEYEQLRCGGLSSSSSAPSLGSARLRQAQDRQETESSGRVQLLLSYDYQRATLDVVVEQCQGLSYLSTAKSRKESANSRLLPNPYVTIQFRMAAAVDRSCETKRTSWKRGTVNPVYGAKLAFGGVAKSELYTRLLRVTVWHNSLVGRDRLLGATIIALDSFDWPNSMTWFDLHVDERKKMEARLSLSVKFVPDNSKKNEVGSFHCLVHRLRLPVAAAAPVDQHLFHAPYITAKLTEAARGGRSEKQTSVVGWSSIAASQSQDVNWQHEFVFAPRPADRLRSSTMRLRLYDRRPGASVTRRLATIFLPLQSEDNGEGCLTISNTWLASERVMLVSTQSTS